MNLSQNFDKFLKFVRKLPIIQILLKFLIESIAFVCRLLYLILNNFFLFGRRYFKGIVNNFIEKKNHSIKCILNKLDKIYELAILVIEIENKLDNALGNNTFASTQKELIESIENLQNSKQGLQSANAEFDEAVKSFFDDNDESKPSPTLPIWILSKLREDWRRDIVEKRRTLINSGCTGIFLRLRTIKYLMEMYWASLMIKYQDSRYGYTDSKAINKSTLLSSRSRKSR